MSSVFSKRQQARNERVLQDLIKTVPDNDRCADCGTKNPGWASWSLGIFLCIRCASLHRKLGTHISKVKSISMDSWTNEQVDNMRKNGNVKSNAIFNPDTKKHPPPISQDDADSAMERHIRAKYEYQTYRRDNAATTTPAARSTARPSVSNSSPPSSASSSKSGKPSGFGASKLGIALFRSSSPASNAKVNQILGTNGAPYTDARKSQSGPVVFPHGMATATPLELYGNEIKSLREMGFANRKQCIEVLQQTDGKMMDAVEILIRLNKAEERRPEPPPKNAAGLMVHKSGPAAVARQGAGGSSSNPFDALDREEPPLPPLPAVKTGPSAPQMHMAMSIPGQVMPQQMGMQGMGVQNGYPMQAGWNSMPIQVNGFQQQQRQQNMSPFQMNPTPQPNQFGQIPQQQLQHPQQTMPSQFSPHTTGSTTSSYNPFMSTLPAATHKAIAQPNLTAQPQTFSPYAQQQQQQQIAQQQQIQLRQLPQLAPLNPYNNALSYPMSAPAHQASYAPQQLPFHRTGIDKSQILALFDAPQLAPPRAQNQVEVVGTPQPPQPQQQQPPTPGAGSNNPFLPVAVPQQSQQSHRSQESVDFGAWQSGRHSPDAFASLAFGGR